MPSVFFRKSLKFANYNFFKGVRSLERVCPECEIKLYPGDSIFEVPGGCEDTFSFQLLWIPLWLTAVVPVTIPFTDYADNLALHAYTPAQIKALLHSLGQTTRGLKRSLHVLIPLALCSRMIRTTWVQSQIASYQRLLKMVLDTYLLNTHHYKVRIKGKVEQSGEMSSALPYTSVK